MSLDRLVLVWNASSRRPGSGCLVGPRLVLTAAHVVSVDQAAPERAVQVLGRQAARDRSGPWCDAICVWASIEHDLALLELATGLPEVDVSGPIPCGRMPRAQFCEGLSAFGYPHFMAQGWPAPPVANAWRGEQPVLGRLLDPHDAGRVRLPFDITSTGPSETHREEALRSGQSVWGGMSGAPVFADTLLVGVVIDDRSAGLESSRLSVVPTRLAFEDQGFLAIARPAGLTLVEVGPLATAPATAGRGAAAFLPPSPWHPSLPPDARPANWDMRTLGDFYGHILRRDDDADTSVPLRQMLSDLLHEDPPFAYRLRGAQGTGKSTSLALLFEWLRQDAPPDPRFTTHFVTAEVYLNDFSLREDRQKVLRQLFADFETLRAAAARRDGPKMLIILDGLSKDNPFNSQVLEQIGLLGDRLHGVVYAVSEAIENVVQAELKRHGLPETRRSFRLISADAAAKADSAFYGDFVRFERGLRGLPIPANEATVIARLRERAEALRFEPIDTHLLSIVLATIDDGKYETEDPAKFLEQYCLERMRKALSGKAVLAPASAAAFDTLRESAGLPSVREPLPPGRERRAVLGLIREHSNIRDFLAAYHLIDLIARGIQDQSARQAICGGVLAVDIPESASRFVKRLLNARAATRTNVMNTIQALHEEVDTATRNTFYYLCGRVEGSNHVGPARLFLDAVVKRIENALVGTKDPAKRLDLQTMLRTAFVSLVYLNDSGAKQRYVKLMLADQEAAAINRGFHLVYYGDIPAVQTKGSARYLDTGEADWGRSRDVLLERLARHVSTTSAEHDVLFEIRLFTLISFVQSRGEAAVAGIGAEALRTLVVGAVARLEQGGLRAYADAFLVDLKRSSFTPWRLLLDLYRLKTESRRGWVVRGFGEVSPARTESVADHCYLACLLAWFILPERLSETDASRQTNYSKARIISMLLVHDTAEAFIGDRVRVTMPAEARREHDAAEISAMEYIRMKDTYRGVEGGDLAYTLWREFEDGDTINARLARDIDRFENLIQLELYRPQILIDDHRQFRARLLAALVPGGLIHRRAEEFLQWADQAPRPIASADLSDHFYQRSGSSAP